MHTPLTGFWARRSGIVKTELRSQNMLFTLPSVPVLVICLSRKIVAAFESTLGDMHKRWGGTRYSSGYPELGVDS
jgi:hypothetical protein